MRDPHSHANQEIISQFKKHFARKEWILTDSMEDASLVVKGFSRLSSSLLSCAEGTLWQVGHVRRETMPPINFPKRFLKLTKFSEVFGVSLKSPRTILPDSPPSISTSKKTLLVTVWLRGVQQTSI